MDRCLFLVFLVWWWQEGRDSRKWANWICLRLWLYGSWLILVSVECYIAWDMLMVVPLYEPLRGPQDMVLIGLVMKMDFWKENLFRVNRNTECVASLKNLLWLLLTCHVFSSFFQHPFAFQLFSFPWPGTLVCFLYQFVWY